MNPDRSTVVCRKSRRWAVPSAQIRSVDSDGSTVQLPLSAETPESGAAIHNTEPPTTHRLEAVLLRLVSSGWAGSARLGGSPATAIEPGAPLTFLQVGTSLKREEHRDGFRKRSG
jgi:hypothetical protein